MATAVFDGYARTGSGTATVAAGTAPYAIEVIYTDPLLPGDSVVVNFEGSPFDFTYEGITSSGQIVASWQDGPSFFYVFGAPHYSVGSPFPAFDTVAFCFLPGTLIATPEGARAVETLTTGDDLLTADGRTVPVRWLGRQTLFTRFGMPGHRAPVLIAAGALGDGLPMRDLRVTADHALELDGALVQAGALVNGTTIRRMTAGELGERLTVYHIETEAHDVVLAEGVPAETFIDNVTRRGFDNYAEFEALDGTPAEPLRELSQPRIMSARQVPAALKARIAEAARQDLEAIA